MNGAAAPSSASVLRADASPRWAIAAALAITVLGTVIGPRLAGATTADGSIITNVACATLNSVLFVPESGWNNWESGGGIRACATSSELMVQSPNIRLSKTCNPTTSAVGGTVTCTMCVENTNAFMEAYNVRITDKIPVNMGWIGSRPNPDEWGGPWTYEVSTTGAVWVAGDPPAGQATPYYLRWTRSAALWPGTSACIAYTLSIL